MDGNICVTLELDRQGRITGIYPSAANDDDLKVIRQALKRLSRPGLAGLLRRLIRFAGGKR